MRLRQTTWPFQQRLYQMQAQYLDDNRQAGLAKQTCDQ